MFREVKGDYRCRPLRQGKQGKGSFVASRGKGTKSGPLASLRLGRRQPRRLLCFGKSSSHFVSYVTVCSDKRPN